MEICLLTLNDKMKFEQYESLLSLVPTDTLEKINVLKFDADKKQKLFSDIFLRYVIYKNLDIKNKDIKFSYNEYGKPSLIGYSEFHFNVSHSKGTIAIAVSDNPIGIDVEQICSINTKIARRFFTANEYNYIQNADNVKQQDKRFYAVWTKKEAYIKWAGKGLSVPLNSFDVLTENLNRSFHTFEIEEYLLSVYSNCIFNQKIFTHIYEEEICRECLNGGLNRL